MLLVLYGVLLDMRACQVTGGVMTNNDEFSGIVNNLLHDDPTFTRNISTLSRMSKQMSAGRLLFYRGLWLMVALMVYFVGDGLVRGAGNMGGMVLIFGSVVAMFVVLTSAIRVVLRHPAFDNDDGWVLDYEEFRNP